MAPPSPMGGVGLAQAVAGVWALLLGVGLLMLGNGLQASLLGVRAAAEGFGEALTGVVMAGFFAGFLVGSVWSIRAIRRVGHVRVFAALASLASIAILAHALFVDPILWFAMRFLTGVCYAGVFVVAESWLNDRVDNAARGGILSLYMLISFAGMGGGQLMLNWADPLRADLFILVSAVISMAVVPVLLSASPAPAPAQLKRATLARLYGASPLGVVGTFGAGLLNGAVFGLGAVYAGSVGFTLYETSLFMGAVIAGAAVLQWPIGKLSDRIDRRTVITLIALLAAILALWLLATEAEPTTAYLLQVALFGGLALSLHSLALAYTNDYLEPEEFVGASGGLVLVLGSGSVLGPLLGGAAIERFGPPGYFGLLAATLFAMVGFAIWRMTRRSRLPDEQQGPYVPISTGASSVAVAVAEEVHAETLQAEELSDEPSDEPPDQPSVAPSRGPARPPSDP